MLPVGDLQQRGDLDEVPGEARAGVGAVLEWGSAELASRRLLSPPRTQGKWCHFSTDPLIYKMGQIKNLIFFCLKTEWI